MQLIHQDQLQDINKILVVSNKKEIYYKFTSIFNCESDVFYLKNNKCIYVNVFYDKESLVPLLNWSKEEHYYFEDLLRRNKRDMFDTPTERWKKIGSEMKNKTTKECINHFKHVKNYLIKVNQRKSKIEEINEKLYQFSFNDSDFTYEKKIFLIDCIINSRDNEFSSNDIIIIYNLEVLMFSYELELEEIYNRLYHTIKNHDINNVYFATFDFESCFNIEDFAKYYLKKFNLSLEQVKKKLWGNNYYSSKGWLNKSEKLPRSFCQFILTPIMQLNDAVINKKEKKIDKMLATLNINVDNKFDFNIVMKSWFSFDSKINNIITSLFNE